ncbi:MAG: cell division protein SepF [bacterium]|nr:cell division protein SepF [bacterium]
MGVLDKFLNAMKLNDEDYDDYDDDYFDEEDDFPEQAPKKKSAKQQDVMHDDFIDAKKEKPTPKVTPMRTTGKVRSTASGMEVCVIKPTSVEDAREITETLLANRTVVLNLEGLDVDIAQRIIDFTSGSTFAISGNLQKISHYIFIITPRSVDISGDFQEILSGAFDVPALNNRF